MMQTKILFLAIFSTFFLSSCFEILEEVNLNSDGSGTLTYTLNLSQSKTKIDAALLLDSVNGFKIPSESEVRSKITEAVNRLKTAEGISDVSTQLNFESYVFALQCKFANTSALNNATLVMSESYNVKNAELKAKDHFYYRPKEKIFKRKGDYSGRLDTEQIGEEYLGSLQNAEFTSIYRFQNEVTAVSNAHAKISPNKKAVMLKFKALDVALGKNSIANTITLK